MMRQRRTFAGLAAAVVTLPIAAQSPAPVTMRSGNYVIQARDTAKAKEIAIVGWPFVLKGNGAFTLTTPDSLTFTGRLLQKDGMAAYTDQSCDQPGVYYVRQERGGYAFDLKSAGCVGTDSGWVKLLFVPEKPRKSP
jgi:hypothetical protein